MQTFRKMMAGMVLATCVIAQAQDAANQTPTKITKTRSAKPKPKTQEEILLEQLNDKFQKLDQVNEKLDDLQQKYDALQKRMAERDAELDATRKAATEAQTTAADARQKTEATQQAIGPEGSTVTKLQNDVESLKTTSTSLTAKVETTQQETKKLEHPDALHFKGVELTPGGFFAAETVDRQRAIGGDVNTQFNGIPFAGQTAGVLSEFNASGRQSRISLLAESKLPSLTMRGYVEADFLGAGTTSNDNQSNSYPLRLRQAWAQADFQSGWTLTGGQMWSLATEYRHGLSNLSEAVPLTIDAQYNVGFTWERQYGFRVVKRIGDRFWLGGSVEEAQTLNIGGHNLPTIAYQQAGNAGGLYNPTANYSYNYAPDLLAKAAYETNWGHFEVFGLGRFFRDRVYPNGPPPPGAQQPATVSALGAFTAKTAGGGIGANARASLFAKKFDIGAHGLIGYGAPTNVVSGCYTEVLPSSSPNGGGNVPGAASNCNADTRNIQEGTFGYWFRFYRGVHGTFQQGIQYSYTARHTWQGIGDPNNNLPGSPKGIDNMWFTSFRYYLPQ